MGAGAGKVAREGAAEGRRGLAEAVEGRGVAAPDMRRAFTPLVTLLGTGVPV